MDAKKRTVKNRLAKISRDLNIPIKTVEQVINLQCEFIEQMALHDTEFNCQLGKLGWIRRKPSQSKDRLIINDYDRLFLRKSDYNNYIKLNLKNKHEDNNS